MSRKLDKSSGHLLLKIVSLCCKSRLSEKGKFCTGLDEVDKDQTFCKYLCSKSFEKE